MPDTIRSTAKMTDTKLATELDCKNGTRRRRSRCTLIKLALLGSYHTQTTPRREFLSRTSAGENA